MIETEKSYSRPDTPTYSQESTLVSIVPFPIFEEKPGLYPGTFSIPAAVSDLPQVLVLGESIHYVYIDKDRGSLRVTNPSYQVAQSVCNDYNSSQLAANIGCHPGLTWVTGAHSAESVIIKYKDKIDELKVIQRRWFVELVKIADDDWEKLRQHQAISDTQRFAAKVLDPKNTRNRPWIVAPEAPVVAATIVCGACGSDIPADVVICKYCRAIINPEKYKKFDFAASAESMKVRM